MKLNYTVVLQGNEHVCREFIIFKQKHMKIAITYIVIFLVLGFTIKYENYHVECYNITSSDYIELKVWSDVKKYNNIKAEKNAIHGLLYSGVMGKGDCITQKPILNSEDAKNEFRKIERKFFSKKGQWKIFIKSSDFVREKSSTNYYIVSVSRLQLINFLIDRKIIKSLNNGF